MVSYTHRKKSENFSYNIIGTIPHSIMGMIPIISTCRLGTTNRTMASQFIHIFFFSFKKYEAVTESIW